MRDWGRWDLREDNFAKTKMYQSVLIYGEGRADCDFAFMIPTFRRSGMLKQAVDSVLRQKGSIRYSIYVVDNCAETDHDTDLLMKKYCQEHRFIRYYRNQKNLGMFGNWNRCIELAPVSWFCILNDDDMLKEAFLQKVFPAVKRTGSGLFGTYREILDQRSAKERRHAIRHGLATRVGMEVFIKMNAGRVIPMDIKDVAYSRHFPCNPFVLDKEKSMALGGFNDEYAPFADMVFFANMMKSYGAGILPDKLTVCRFSTNESTKVGAMRAVMETGPRLAEEAAKGLAVSREKRERLRQEAVCIEYYIFPGVRHKIRFQEVMGQYKLDRKYGSAFFRKAVLVKYKLGWALLLFRKGKGRAPA